MRLYFEHKNYPREHIFTIKLVNFFGEVPYGYKWIQGLTEIRRP